MTARWCTTSEAARALGRSERTVRRMCAAGELTAKRGPDGQWRIDRAEFDPVGSDVDAIAQRLAAHVREIGGEMSASDTLASILRSLEDLRGEVHALCASIEASADVSRTSCPRCHSSSDS